MEPTLEDESAEKTPDPVEARQDTKPEIDTHGDAGDGHDEIDDSNMDADGGGLQDDEWKAEESNQQGISRMQRYYFVAGSLLILRFILLM